MQCFCAFCVFSRPNSFANQLVEFILRQNRNAELLGLFELAARGVAGDEVAGIFRNAAGRLAAELAYQRLDVLAAVLRERAGDDERLAGEIDAADLGGAWTFVLTDRKSVV